MSNNSNESQLCFRGFCGSREEIVEYITENMKPSPMESVFILLYAVVFIVGLVGNFLVCFVVYRTKSMHNATNSFIVNLAVTDFLVILVCLPPTVLTMVTDQWYFGEAMCHITVFLQTASVVSSVLTLSAISLERFYGICLPFESWMSKRKVILIIVLIWTVSTCIAFPHLVYMRLKVSRVFPEYLSYCHMNLSIQSLKIYRGVLVFFVFLLPLFIIGILYTKISMHLWSSTIPGQTPLSQSRSSMAAVNQNLARKKVSKMLIAVVILFALCYLPIHMMFFFFIFDLFEDDANASYITTLSMVSLWLCYFNSAINPIIYNFMSARFQGEFKRVICCEPSQSRQYTYTDTCGKTEDMVDLKDFDGYSSTDNHL